MGFANKKRDAKDAGLWRKRKLKARKRGAKGNSSPDGTWVLVLVHF